MRHTPLSIQLWVIYTLNIIDHNMIKYVISKEFVEMSQFYITFYIIIILYNIKLFTGIVKNNMFFYILYYFEITLYYIYKEIKNNKIFYRYFY